ncbi:cysteine desulfurase [Thermodesulfobacterium sp. TA1]|uniref:cysteine desulfurase family protein n=1 Tax=Thermodesulfobacterium sp. TA1 TaxID=2234087 RepID=UPI001231D193|nr:cysteine desulfurase family protein [Thermodesulfobacterium sp. TA1]QER42881.1 cysteine desulfurase [Thermodesulfobacterium sp. TA1]
MQDLKPIYLDYNATTPVLPEVLEAFNRYSSEEFANPSSGHALGKRVKQSLEKFREEVASLLNAFSEEIIFTSGGTESNHLSLLGIALTQGKGHVLVSAFEHPSVLNPVVKLLEMGFEVDFIPVNPQGYVEPDEVLKRIKRHTFLVSVMLANNEIGTIQPVEEIAKICREREILFHTDACQAVGKISVDVKKIGCHLLSFAGHKMYAPKGIGGLFVEKGVSLSPLFWGGGQERGIRPGTEPVGLIAALAKAAEIAKKDVNFEAERLNFLKETLYQGLKEVYPNLYRYGLPEKTLPNTLTISFVGKDGRKILEDLPEICASTGSACHDRKGSNTLIALKVNEKIAQGTIRFSLGRYTTLEDIERTIKFFQDYFV